MGVGKSEMTSPRSQGSVKRTTGPRDVCSPGLSASAEIRSGTMAREPSQFPAAQRKYET